MIGGIAFVLATAFFSFFSGVDLWVTGLFYTDGAGFFARDAYPVVILREIFLTLFSSTVIYTCMALLTLLFFIGSGGVKYQRKWLFVLLCLVIGPGLVTNIIFKDNWGRARPVQVEAFGGTKNFTPPLVPVSQCGGTNCSFVCGESSSIFALFFAFALLSSGALRQTLLFTAISLGMVSGLIRIIQGKHFLSDVIYSGIFMWLSTLITWWLVFVFWPKRADYYRELKLLGYSTYRALAKGI
jgi:lipid A 4'-phosphatase